MKKLQKCIENKRVNNSQTREIIYKIISNDYGCLTISEIIEKSVVQYPKKISVNTIYRHLRFFINCGLVFAIQDDLKKTYYCLNRNELTVFSICPICNDIQKIKINACDELENSEFVTVHKKCKECE